MMSHQSIGYLRVSSIDQNPERQLQNIELDRRFVDMVCGSSSNRPELLSCMEYVRDGDMLYIDSIDRLARNLRDLKNILDVLVNKGVIVQFVKENLRFSGAQDHMANLTLHIMGAFAEFERSVIRARQREVIELAKKSGKKMGRPAVLNDKHKKQAKELHEQGMSIRKIAMTMNVCRASIYKLLDKAPKR